MTFSTRCIKSSIGMAALAAAGLVFAQASAPMGSSASAAGAKGMVAAADKDFFMKAAQGGHAEVETGKLASSKATNTQAKSFGQMMVTDHSKANEELSALASSKGVTLPAEPSAKHKAELKKLSAASGAAFDRAYADAMVKDHKETVALFRKTSTGARDADVKAFATKTLPTLEQHLKMAEDMKKSVAAAK